MAGLSTGTAPPILKFSMADIATMTRITLALVVGRCKPRYPKKLMDVAVAYRSMVDNPVTKSFEPIALDRSVNKVIGSHIANRATPPLHPRSVTENTNRMADGKLSKSSTPCNVCRNSRGVAPSYPYTSVSVSSFT